MTTDQAENYRLGFFTCLAIMREEFLKVAKTPENDEEIRLYLEANDKAHELLSKVIPGNGDKEQKEWDPNKRREC